MEIWEIKDGKREKTARHAAIVSDGQYVQGLSGMTCVIPAAHIAEVVAAKDLHDMREQREIDRLKKMRHRWLGLQPDLAKASPSSGVS